MKIGIDIDGVIADFVGSFLPRLNKYCRCEIDDIIDYRFWENFKINRKEFDKIWNEEVDKKKLYRELKLISGSYGALNELSKYNKLILISSRPKHLNKDTLSWLRHHKISFARLELVEDTKEKISKMIKCDLVIEDSLEVARRVEAQGVPVLLFDYPWNRLGRNIKRIKNWTEVIQEVKKLRE